MSAAVCPIFLDKFKLLLEVALKYFLHFLKKKNDSNKAALQLFHFLQTQTRAEMPQARPRDLFKK